VRISSQKIVVAAAISLVSSVTIAASKPVDPYKLPKVECSSLHYSETFLDRYPHAPAACLEARVYKGETYVEVKGKVYILDNPTLSVALLDPYGNTLGTVTVRDSKLRVIMNGKVVNVAELRTDEAITLWVPESIFSADPTAASR
jgi:hypothetical protein